MTSIQIRRAAPPDAVAIAAICNDGIRGRTATFETTERTPEDIACWFGAGRPLLVAEHGDVAGREVIGWIHASSYRARPCYAGVTEFSVYVSKPLRGQRVGDALMAAFLPACAEAGYWKVASAR